MRPIFTIHAGEFLAADYIERNYAKDGLRVWVPSKDDGIDLLVTSNGCRHAVSLQVKFSKNFGRNRDCDASGWWLINRNKSARLRRIIGCLCCQNHLARRCFLTGCRKRSFTNLWRNESENVIAET